MGHKLVLAADHGGFALKEVLRGELSATYEVVDVGATTLDPEDDYPAFAAAAARVVQQAQAGATADSDVVGVLLCRTGAGMAIMANRFPLVRAVVCRSVADAVVAREKNNANVLVLEAEALSAAEAEAILRTFLSTDFAGGRHARRVEALEEYV